MAQMEAPPVADGYAVEQHPSSTADSKESKIHSGGTEAQTSNPRPWIIQRFWVFSFVLNVIRHIMPRGATRLFVLAAGFCSDSSRKFNVTRLIIRYTYPPIARLHHIFYVRRGHLPSLKRSIYFSRKLLDNIAKDDPSLPHYQQRLGTSLYNRFTHLKNIEDLRFAVALQRTALHNTPPNQKSWLWHAQSLDISLREEFETVETTRSIEDAIALETQAIIQLKDDLNALSWWQHALAMSHRLRFNAKGQVPDLDAASHWVDLSIANTPKSNVKSLMSRRNTRASIFECRFKVHSTLSDLDAAITELQFLVDKAHDPITLAYYLASLGNCLHSRFNFLGQKEDLDGAIDHLRSVVRRIGTDHPILPMVQHNLSIVLQARYNLSNSNDDLEEALQNSERATEGVSCVDKNRCYVYHQLGNILLLQHEKNDDLQTLELALKWFNEALNTGNPMDKNYYKIQEGMAQAHRALFAKQGNVEDIELALNWINSALAAPSLKDQDLADLYYILGALHRARWLRYQRVEDLDPAVNAHLLAVQKSPASHPELYKRQAMLGVTYSDRYKRLTNHDDQEKAMEWLHRAVDTAPSGHQSLLDNLARLSHEYSARYAWKREEEDLKKAITYALRAVDLLPKESNERHSALFRALALAYSQKADLDHDDECIRNAYLWFRRYIETSPSPDNAWIQANEWAKFATRHQHKEEAIAAYAQVMGILPDLLWIGSTMAVRHEAIKRYDIASITSEAVDTCIRFNTLEKAVEFVEQGLAITFQHLLSLKANHEVLQKAHPKLAEELKGLSNILTTISTDSQAGDQEAGRSWSPEARCRHTADERNKLLRRIRELPGFEDFLLPKPFDELQEAASEGPVVILCATRIRSNALILTQSGVAALLLLTREGQLNELRDRLMGLAVGSEALDSAGMEGGKDVLRNGMVTSRNKSPLEEAALDEVLDCLWKVVVSPILDRLAESGITEGRIWWCPTGPFAQLPVHAAGPPNAFVHSYTPTLGGLIHARKAHAKRSSKPTLTAIAVSEFEETIPRLPGVPEEVDRVQSLARATKMESVILVNEEATIKNVIQALTKSSWLHIACHGQQNTDDPLKSALLLHGERLELQKLMEMNLPDAQFVFLSAGETAMGDRGMPNESLHLAGGMLSAGFKGAVGTLWAINDLDGPYVAERVYDLLFANGKKPDAKDAALALHDAIRSLRRSGVPAYRWAPFIHIGV